MKNIEITRSFSQKLNTGNYTTADFFCSAKAEVSEEMAETKSEELFNLCYREVMSSIKSYQDKGGEAALKQWDEKKQEIYNEDSKIEDIRVEEKLT